MLLLTVWQQMELLARPSLMVQTNYTWIGWGGYIVLIVICIILLIAYRRSKAKEASLSKRLNHFISSIHDIRTPITLMKAPLSELERQQTLSEENKKQVKTAIKNIDKLLSIINKLLEWQKLENQTDMLQVSNCDIEAYLDGKVSDFKTSMSQKGIEIQLNVSPNMPNVWIDRDKMDRIVENLLSNALKYTEQGSIHISVKSTEKNWTLEICDTGIGIPKSEQQHIFSDYYRANNATEKCGMGIGLMITRRMVELHQGKIEFTSTEGKGTSFSITFPITPKAKLIEHKTAKETEQDTENKENLSQIQESGKNTLLLAEDDEDMREYLKNSLSAEYEVVTVPDGEQALEMAKKINPDLIISDVIMPVLQGDELCRILKSSLETSHIPVILLTALSERENIIFGLEAGANDYIIKPFDLSVLKARLRNVIQNRQRLRSAVLSIEEHSEEMDYSSQLDKEFLDKVMEVINGELSNPDFCINDFCRMMGMSRTSIYNKIKTLTGQGPNDFIRIMRLNKAMELLKTRRYTIGEVSSQVGFSDPKYFSTCFKKQFGTSPSKI